MRLVEEEKVAMAASPEAESRHTTNGKSGDTPAVLISHPTGNQNVRNAVRSLFDNDMLAEFWTTVAWDPQSRWNRILPSDLRSQLARRAFDDVPQDRVKCAPFREMVRLGVRSTPLESFLCSDERMFSVIGMYRHFDARVARRIREVSVDAVYAYEGAALQSFREAKRQGITTIYDLPSAYWYWERNVMREEAARTPELASVLPKLSDSKEHMQEKDEEVELSDLIIVASQHVRRTLAGVVPEDKILVVPYGAPPVRIRPEAPIGARRPLRVLFAGILHQRKGIGYLLKAVEVLGPDVELTLIGQRFGLNAIVDSACKRWRWFESLPHSQVLDVMMQSDVLVLPSISEAFGLVVTEALACGLPVVVTPHVGASDLITDGQDGFVVPAASAEAIAECLSALNRDRELLAYMSHNAQLAAARHPWEAYRKTLTETVRVASWH
jgi:alpha-maltose-1-phosphate synthase